MTKFCLVTALLLVCASYACGGDDLKIIDAQIGKPVDLRQFDGPNINLTVTAVDISSVTITLQDYSRMSGAASGSSMSFGPTATRTQVKKEDPTVLLNLGGLKVLYIDDLDTAQNHVKLGIVAKEGRP